MTAVSSPAQERRRRRLTPALLAGVAVIATVASIVIAGTGSGRHRPWVCISSNEISTLTSWSRTLGFHVNCAVAYTDASPNWQGWVDPWITQYRQNWPKFDWVDWFDRGRAGRHLILTQSLIPSGLRGTAWLQAGAQGRYEPYAQALAGNLVSAGMGSVVIRLGHEANGTWYADSVPGTPTGDRLWAKFWANTVTAMRSVPGAHFTFDWTVNAGVRPIAPGSFYPGDKVVDVIGVDAYDSLANPPTTNRLSTILNEPDGLASMVAFARRHHKPLSVPEWGLVPSSHEGGGDDVPYVKAIAHVTASGDVLYQSLFVGGAEGQQLLASPRALAVYRKHIGSGG